jgi:hypothetical protein
MPLSVAISNLAVGALVMLSLSLEFWCEDLPVWSHLYAVMAGVGIGVAFLGAFSASDAVRVVYA